MTLGAISEASQVKVHRSGGTPEPYLSVVVTARNDNHGGDLLFRMQVFVNALVAQCNRFGLPTELIVVEWNPPADRPRLAEALAWPEDGGQLAVRIIEVEEQLHHRFRHSDRLLLFQMIAKNVGIRRARGKYVLATNVDIVFSDGLMEFLVARRLRPRRLYRVDRHDVDGVRDADLPIEEQLRICSSSLIRICARYGTRDLRTGEFYRVWLKYATLPWYLGLALQAFESARRRLGIRLNGIANALLGPGRTLRARLVSRRHATRRRVLQRRRHLARRAGRLVRWSAEAVAANLRSILVARPLMLVRALQRLEARVVAQSLLHLLRQPRQAARIVVRPLRVLDVLLLRCAWLALGVLRLARYRVMRTARRYVHRAVPRPIRKLVRMARFARRSPRAALRRAAGALRVNSAKWRGRWETLREAVTWARALPALHTNACGDFTLMSREGWFELNAYPELHLFSMFIDSIFVYQAHWAGFKEELLPFPIYHLEHGAGFRPDRKGLKELTERLERAGIPQIDNRQFRAYAIEMYRTGRPIDFNDDGWGFAGLELPETVLCFPERAAVLHAGHSSNGSPA
jgi:hypothetical protein